MVVRNELDRWYYACVDESCRPCGCTFQLFFVPTASTTGRCTLAAGAAKGILFQCQCQCCQRGLVVELLPYLLGFLPLQMEVEGAVEEVVEAEPVLCPSTRITDP